MCWEGHSVVFSTGQPSNRATFAGVLIALATLLAGAAPAAAQNPIVVENQQPGSTGWHLDDNKATNHEIEGYASAASVNKGGSISFMVSVSTAVSYTMDVYRMGYYPVGCSPDCGG